MVWFTKEQITINNFWSIDLEIKKNNNLFLSSLNIYIGIQIKKLGAEKNNSFSFALNFYQSTPKHLVYNSDHLYSF